MTYRQEQHSLKISAGLRITFGETGPQRFPQGFPPFRAASGAPQNAARPLKNQGLETISPCLLERYPGTKAGQFTVRFRSFAGLAAGVPAARESRSTGQKLR